MDKEVLGTVQASLLVGMPQNPIEKVLRTVRSYEMLKCGDRVLAAVSGGSDSVFLLLALVRLKRKLGLASIAAAHLDHGLRGRESRDDMLFVKRLAASLGVKFVGKKIRLKKAGPADLSVEEAGRLARYGFFKEAARKTGSNVIATGHTLDDQAETVLMRMMQGSSAKGIIGVAPVRPEGGVRIARPLIELTKAEIERYLVKEGVEYRTDRTNSCPVYFRNVVRSEIIPFLERYNPALKRSLFKLAEHLREDYEFIREAKKNAECRAHCTGQKKVTLKLKDIVIQPRALQKEILKDAFEAAGGDAKPLSFKHWKDMEGLIRRKGTGSSLDLPGSIRLTKTAREIVFGRRI